ncbi:hypothetical protein CL617_00695 [archaeon]|nr:hypothetical protein [archaeon]
MKCEYCEKEKNKLYHTFKYGFICWKCLNKKTIKKQKCMNENCNKEFDLKIPNVMRKDRCNPCFQYFRRNHHDRTSFPKSNSFLNKLRMERKSKREKDLHNHLNKLRILRKA